MTNQPDETVVFKYLVDAQDAIARAKEFRAQVDSIKEQMKSMAASSGQSFKDLAQGMQQVAKINFQQQIMGLKSSSPIVKQATSDYNQLRTAISTAYKELKPSSQIVAGVAAAFGFGMIQTAIAAIRGLIGIFKEAGQAGYEFAKGLYQINVAVDALRRAGTNITFGEVLDQLKALKKEFGIFSTKDLVVGAASFLNLNRDMGFTKEQLFALQETVAKLAVINGRAMDEVQKTVALALSSGYTEGLQRLGVSINRVTIAEEAARLGYAKSYMALTEQQRALATYNLILQKTAVYNEKLLEYQKSLPGQIDTTTAAITDANAKLGEETLATQLIFVKFKLGLITAIETTYGMMFKLIGLFVDVANHAKEIAELTPFASMARSAQELIDKLTILNKLLPQAGFFRPILENIPGGDQFLDFYDRVAEILRPKITKKPEEIVPKDISAFTDEQIAAAESIAKQLLDLQNQYNIDARDLAIDLARDLARIKEEGDYKLQQIQTDSENKMREIAEKAADDIKEAQIKYDSDVQQAWDEYYSNLASTTEKHSDRLLKIEEDYQEKLLRLREGFLMDLEDALQARDARQVLQLIKRYNLERAQAKRERDQNLTDEERSYQQQLRDLERQRNDRLRKLQEELRLRTEAIIRQRDEELRAERAAEATKMIQQIAANKREKVEREKKYKQDLDDLALHLQDRVTELTNGFISEQKITSDGLQGILDIISGYLGPSGPALAVYKSFANAAAAYIASAMAAAMGIMAMSPIPNYVPHISPIPRHAKGGLEIATKPTMAIYGEGGVPELHAFIPLTGGIGSLSSSGKPAKIPEIQSRGKGKAQVEILLGAGLEGRIVDKALDNVADIIIKRKLQ